MRIAQVPSCHAMHSKVLEAGPFYKCKQVEATHVVAVIFLDKK